MVVMSLADALPNVTRNRALAEGEAGRLWLATLDEKVARVAQAWSLTPGAVLTGGTGALVLGAQTEDGTDVVLKLGMPGDEDILEEARVLEAAKGQGYAGLLAHSYDERTLLLECLGEQLTDSDYSVDQQITILCQTLVQAWRVPTVGLALMTGAEKAHSLANFITENWSQWSANTALEVRDRALAFAHHRAAAFDPDQSVLVHGDAHGFNTLYWKDSSEGLPLYKFVDPDGIFSEPAYDLGIAMREWSQDLLEGDVVERGRSRLGLLHRLTGVDEKAIFQWGFLERVSTGLLCRSLKEEVWAQEMLGVAEAWLRLDP